MPPASDSPEPLQALNPSETGAVAGVTPDEIDRLPPLPGVYIMRGEDGAVLYVGKAANLRSRVHSYFTKAGEARFNVRYLMGHVRTVETIVTANEAEAFLLEDTLIKREQPRYNIRLRDDKTYVSVRFDLRQKWPRAVVLRRRRDAKDGATYLGPFASASTTRDALRMLQRIFPIRSCPDFVLKNRKRACLLHQIGRCCAPCVEPVDKAEYDEMVRGTILALEGRSDEVLRRLREKMQRHSEAMEYERAAATRDRIAAVERTAERQLVHRHDGDDRDVVALERGAGRAAFAVFSYRNGLLVRGRPFLFKDLDRPAEEMMEEFLSRFYADEPPPKEIVVSPEPRGAEFLAERFSEKRGAVCRVVSPRRGDKTRLVEVARENCARLVEQGGARERTPEEIGAEIMDRLKLDVFPDPIECYDISTFQGRDTVGAMVRFRECEPDKSGYRRYKIREVEGQDDFAAMRETLTRRLKRAIEEDDALPGLILIDGGKGQLAVAGAVFEELGVEGVALASIAKSRVKRRGDAQWRTEERIFLPGRKNPVVFPASSPALHVLQRARDEAHRFGITHHRKLRDSRNLRSALEDVPGVGKAKATALLAKFGSVKAVGAASPEELAAVEGVSRKLAERILESFSAEATEDAPRIAEEPEPDARGK